MENNTKNLKPPRKPKVPKKPLSVPKKKQTHNKNTDRNINIAVFSILGILIIGYVAYRYWYVPSRYRALRKNQININAHYNLPTLKDNTVPNNIQVNYGNNNVVETKKTNATIIKEDTTLFNNQEGTISLWTKSSNWYASSYVNLINFYSSAGKEILLLRKATQSNTAKDYISLILYTGPGSGSTSGWTVSSDKFYNNKWHHISLVWKLGEVVDIYMDGQQLNEYINSQQANNRVDKDELNILNDYGTLYLGRKYNDGGTAEIEDLEFYSKALTNKEVEEIFNLGL